MPKETTPEENLMRFPDITHQIEVTFNDGTSFLCDKLDEAVAQCALKAVKYQGKSVLDLRIAFQPKNDRMVIAAELSTSYPSPEPFPINAFVDRSGRLCKEDPAQLKLPHPVEIRRGGE